MLAGEAHGAGDQEQLDLVRSKMAETIPPDRLRPLPEYMENLLTATAAWK
jgi:hypothetical protein